MGDFNELDDCDFHLDPSGDQLLAEARRLWVDLTAGTTNYSVDALRIVVQRRLETLPYDLVLQAQVDALLAAKRSCGRNAFINRLYKLIGDRYQVEVPHIDPLPRRK